MDGTPPLEYQLRPGRTASRAGAAAGSSTGLSLSYGYPGTRSGPWNHHDGGPLVNRLSSRPRAGTTRGSVKDVPEHCVKHVMELDTRTAVPTCCEGHGERLMKAVRI